MSGMCSTATLLIFTVLLCAVCNILYLSALSAQNVDQSSTSRHIADLCCSALRGVMSGTVLPLLLCLPE